MQIIFQKRKNINKLSGNGLHCKGLQGLEIAFASKLTIATIIIKNMIKIIYRSFTSILSLFKKLQFEKNDLNLVPPVRKDRN